MKRKTIAAFTATLCGVLGLGLLILPALAQQGPGEPPATPSEPRFTRSNHRTTEISLRRAGATGRATTPSYKLTLRSNGTIALEGDRGPGQRNRTGRLHPDTFNRLASFIRNSGFEELSNEYAGAAMTGSAEVYTGITFDGGSKVVRNYGGVRVQSAAEGGRAA